MIKQILKYIRSNNIKKNNIPGLWIKNDADAVIYWYFGYPKYYDSIRLEILKLTHNTNLNIVCNSASDGLYIYIISENIENNDIKKMCKKIEKLIKDVHNNQILN